MHRSSDGPPIDPLRDTPSPPISPARDDDTYTAYAIYWDAGRFHLVIHRDRDMHAVWGDGPLEAATPADMPAAAAARLARSTGWYVAGEWEPSPVAVVDPHRIKAQALLG